MILRLALLAWTTSLSTSALAAPSEQPHTSSPTPPAAPADGEAAPPRDPVEEGVWAWLERMDGEILPEKAAAEISTDAEAEVREQVAAGTAAAVDVPNDYYENPARTLEGDPLFLDQIDVTEFDIPIEVTPEVVERLKLYLGSHRKYIHKWLERKSRYEPMIREELAKAGLPQDLIYLSMIESGFNAYAYSSAHAAGLWQFIPTTGQYYGLDVDWWTDERRDPEKATVAALQMLGELHKQFGDWYLAFASYNTGPGRVKSALGRVRRSDSGKSVYWDMINQDLLHPETQGYVPKIVAAAIIGHYPERYGFTGLKPEARLVYDTVKVEGSVDVAVLARCAGVDEEAFRLLNPALRRYATPDGTTDIRVPIGTGDAFSTALAKVPPEERMQIVQHKVSRGETLSIIASRYGVSSTQLAQANGLRNPNNITVGQWLVVPMRGEAPPVQPVRTAVIQTEAPKTDALKAEAPKAEAPKAPATSHRVRSGETLSIIADRYNVTVSELVRWNGLSSAGHIEVGQTIKLAGGSAPAAEAPAGEKRTVTVKAGDTLGVIADRAGVSLSDVMRWNGIDDAGHIEVGQSLVVYGGKAPAAAAAPAAAPTTYKVRSGDTLSEIADRFRVGVSDLQKWNGLSGSSIQVGQTLKVSRPSSSSSSSSSGTSWSYHTVQRGDSLGLIADRYRVSVSELRSWNGLSGSTIYPGQKLKVKKK